MPLFFGVCAKLQRLCGFFGLPPALPRRFARLSRLTRTNQGEKQHELHREQPRNRAEFRHRDRPGPPACGRHILRHPPPAFRNSRAPSLPVARSGGSPPTAEATTVPDVLLFAVKPKRRQRRTRRVRHGSAVAIFYRLGLAPNVKTRCLRKRVRHRGGC